MEIIERYVTPGLAYVVHLERIKAKVVGGEDIAPSALWIAIRVTVIFRPEEGGTWKVVHRHAASVTTAQPAESVRKE